MRETKFKQTEVGMIPSDWEVKCLGELCKNISSGKNKIRINSGKYAVYGSTGIIGHCDKFCYEGENILIARVGANAGFLNKAVGKYDVSDNTLVVEQLRANTNFILEYLKFYNLNKLVFGSGQPLITGGQVKALQIALPPYDEQQKIATALSDIDNLITTTEKLIAKKKALKQGAMQTLLSGKMRIQNGKWIKTTHFKQTELGPIPQDWEVKKLGSLCSLYGRIGFRGYTRKDLVGKHQGAISFSPSDIYDQKIDYSNCTYISLFKYEESPEIKVHNGDILFGKTASIGKCALIENLTEKATINPQFVLIKNFKCDNHYLYYQLIDKPFQTNIWSICGGSTIPTMSQEKLKQQLIPCPPSLEEQTAIATVLSDMDTEIATLETKLAKYRQLKTGMMQQLLTGKVRLV